MASPEVSPRQPERLLGILAVAGLVRSPEVAVTRALAWLASRAHVADGLGALVERSGLRVDSESQWFAEVRAEDGTRTDLECVHVESSAPVVVVEAKLTAAMTSDQLRHYAAGQRRRLLAGGWDRGVLAVLVPVHRRHEAQQKLAHALEMPGDTDPEAVGDGVMLRGVVWTFDELLGAISPDGSEDPDVNQLADLIAVEEALDIRPFSEHELVRPDGTRRRDLWVIADRVSAAIAPAGSRLPPSGEDSGFEWRRYVVLTPGGTNVAIGVRRHVGADPPDEWTSLLWLRVHRDTPSAEVAVERLARRYPNITKDVHGHTWLALDVPAGAGGADVVDAVRTQVEEVAAVILEAEPD
jgi:hypothetical protein